MNISTKRFLVSILLMAAIGNWTYADVQLTRNGKTDYQIILPQDASDNLKYAAHELKIHLEQASGAFFAISQQSLQINHQIILSENNPELQNAEFEIRPRDHTLLLSGGGESGIHHAVHDFLETDCGFIGYDARGGKKVPDLKNFTLPDISRKKSYDSIFRSMSPDYFFYRPESHYFLYRNRMNLKTRLYPLPGMDKDSLNFQNGGTLAGNGVNDYRRASPASHTFFDYIPDVPNKSRIKELRGKGYFNEHPEYFSMNQEGERIVRQLCFSNPDLREEFTKNFYEHIRNTPHMNLFSVTAFDMPGQICHCKECQESVAKYKTNGAPVFLFVKELAEAVGKAFPHVKIWTYAYRKEQTEFPPIGLNLPDNVIVNFCPIDDDMSKNWESETNAETYRNLQEWKKHCPNITLGYYVNPWTFGTSTVLPLGNVYRCAQDIVLAHKAGVIGYNFSHPVGVASMTGFTELQSYLMARLMRAPELNIDFLNDDFMKIEYGPAAPLMRKYLNEQEKVAKETRVFVKWNAVVGVWNSFLKSQDVVRWQGYFDQMEKLTASNPAIYFSVRRVRVPLDMMTLRFFRRIKREMPEYETDVNELGVRIRTVFQEATIAFYPQSDPQIKKHKENNDNAINRLVANMTIQEGTEPKGLPKEIFGEINPSLIFEFYPGAMGKSAAVKDGDAAWNQAIFNNETDQEFPIQFLKYDAVENIWEIFSEIRSSKDGMEGKYCFYNIGETSITPSFEMRGHFKEYKYLFRIFPGEVWMPGTDDTVTVYVSLKLTGPKYYPGSQQKNAIACDRIVFVRKTND
ncbi:MAG: DUF4838 domain-containing protein [Victivallales bacterium]|nr:DUF4838 domain-containing protein [Victivallales bacterium]